MQFLPIKTRPLLPPQDDIYPVLDEFVSTLHERDVLVITSKVLGIHQGRCVKIETETKEEKDALIMAEADAYIPRDQVPNEYALLTVKDNTLVSSAGIDKSNTNGYYVMWPENNQQLLQEIWEYLRRRDGLKDLGIISVDSHSLPLRYGTLGISTGFYGTKPVRDCRGAKDIFGRPLQVTRMNIVDSLAGMSVTLMGEGAECTPLLIIRDSDIIEFTDNDCYDELMIPVEDDMFYPLLRVFHDLKKSKQ